MPGQPWRLSVLDQAPIAQGSTGADALRNSVDLARLAEATGYHRYWVAEHHGTPMLACASPEALIAPIAGALSGTDRPGRRPRARHRSHHHVRAATRSPVGRPGRYPRTTARRLGADEVVVTRRPDEMNRHANSLDFILDTVAAPNDLEVYLRLLKRDRTLCLVGVPELPHPSPSVDELMTRRRSIACLSGGSGRRWRCSTTARSTGSWRTSS